MIPHRSASILHVQVQTSSFPAAAPQKCCLHVCASTSEFELSFSLSVCLSVYQPVSQSIVSLSLDSECEGHEHNHVDRTPRLDKKRVILSQCYAKTSLNMEKNKFCLCHHTFPEQIYLTQWLRSRIPLTDARQAVRRTVAMVTVDRGSSHCVVISCPTSPQNCR